MKVKKLVIDRSTWGKDKLLNNDGTMCCLGFLALECGAAPDEIELCPDIESVPNIDWPAAFISVVDLEWATDHLTNSELAVEAMDINDAGPNSIIKEKRLIKIFKKAGITLSFKGKDR